MELIYEDASLLVFNKPSGLLSVPGRGPDKQDCLSLRVQAIYPDALIVHRLDRDTSGLLLLARGQAAQSALSRAFAARQVHKRYLAVVEGTLAPVADAGWGVIDLPITVDWPNRPLHIVDYVKGKPSVSRWRVRPDSHRPETGLDYGDAASTRLELEPVTGRTHQLRVHLQAIGFPILGDTLYAPPAARSRANRLLLHACELRLVHPFTGEVLDLVSPPPF